jgi:hypothetical protein
MLSYQADHIPLCSLQCSGCTNFLVFFSDMSRYWYRRHFTIFLLTNQDLFNQLGASGYISTKVKLITNNVKFFVALCESALPVAKCFLAPTMLNRKRRVHQLRYISYDGKTIVTMFKSHTHYDGYRSYIKKFI